MNSVQEKFGIIVLLDALGIQNATIPESKHFVKSLREYAEGVFYFLSGYTEVGDLKKHFVKVKPITRTFGDTFLISWAIPNESNCLEYLEAIGSVVSSIIQKGIIEGILFRGAISIGDYLESETTIIGPAITDAASWHEQANWFGCIATPNCTLRINDAKFERKFIHNLIEYDVPIKSQKSIRLWCVNWANSITFFEDEANPLNWFYKHVSKLVIPLGTEEKYYNSEKFLKYFLSKKNI